MKKILLLIFVCLLLCSCSNKNNSEINSIEDFNNIKCGVITGSFHDQFVKNNYSNNNIELIYQNTATELLMSLRSNKIDAIVTDTPVANLFIAENDDIKKFELNNSNIESGFIFSKESLELRDEFNDFIKRNKENGFLDRIEDKWYNHPSSDTRIEKREYTPTKRTINVIASSASPPFCYEVNGELQGYCFELLFEFAYETGYGLQITESNFEGVMSGISSGKFEMGVDEINMTENRKKNMVFSDPINVCSISVISLKNDTDIVNSVDDLVGRNMGCMSGSVYDRTIKEKIENSTITYFNSRSELIMGLKLGKIEGYLADKPVAIVSCVENKGIKYLEESLDEVEYGFCFSRNASHMREQFNEYLANIKTNGTLEKLQEKWISEDCINQSIDELELTGENGTIKVCTTPDAAPFSFFKDNKYEGYETELITMFAHEYGYNLEISSISFDAIISAISSNKYDVAFNGIYITEERKQSVDFSDEVYNSSVVAIVRSGEKESTNIIETIKNKFYRTFIEEDRYKIIVNGINTTLLISGASLLFGTIFGFIIFLISRKLGKWFIKLSDAIAYIISGMPIVVLLMVLFYIIFAQSSLSGIVISIIGFSLVICYSVYGMLKTGVGAIDKGQFEGALALGYTDTQTLFKFILPQAFRIIMPSYRNEIVSLIKSSSVVGYVTVEDLTRASDLIRSRTYDAFFPLIVTAVIYFILAWLLTKLANLIQIKFLPNEKSKEEILKKYNK